MTVVGVGDDTRPMGQTPPDFPPQSEARPPGRPRRPGWMITAVFLLAAGLTGYGLVRRQGGQAGAVLATAPARSGEFREIVQCRGELTARRSLQLAGPLNVPDLRIVWLAPPSSAVKNGDPVIRFDTSTARQQLAEKNAALLQAQAALDQAVAQAGITAEQDKRDLAAAEHQVERARLQASLQEILSEIQGEEARIALGLARERLRVQEAAVDLHATAAKARIASLTRVRDKAREEVELTKDRIARMEIRAPMDGFVIFLTNYTQGWMNAKPFKVGDRTWPGSVIGEIPDLDTLELKGRAEEIDRGRMRIGDEVRVYVDSMPEKPLRGELVQISPMTEMNFEWPPSRSFRAYAKLLDRDARLKPGMNGRMDVVVNRIPNAVSIPSKAVFTRQGKPIVYVASGSRFRAAEVEVIARNPDEVAVKGLHAGQSVALAEAEKESAR